MKNLKLEFQHWHLHFASTVFAQKLTSNPWLIGVGAHGGIIAQRFREFGQKLTTSDQF